MAALLSVYFYSQDTRRAFAPQFRRAFAKAFLLSNLTPFGALFNRMDGNHPVFGMTDCSQIADNNPHLDINSP